jgi:hypothetical protein
MNISQAGEQDLGKITTKDSSKCTLIYKYPTLNIWGLELTQFAIDTFNAGLKVVRTERIRYDFADETIGFPTHCDKIVCTAVIIVPAKH